MSTRPNKFVAGFTIVEILIALAITALLLTAIAVAFNASIVNYQENEDIFRTINNARQALSRITSQLRTGLVDPNAAYLSEDLCKLDCADGSKIIYWYDSTDNTLYLQDHSTGNDYVLCDNVTAMTFIKDNNTPTGDIKSVQISMTVENNNIQRTLSAASVIRRVLE